MKSYASSKTASRTVAESNSAGVSEVGKKAERGHLGGGVDSDEQKWLRMMKLKKMSSKPRHAYCITHLRGRESKKEQNKRKNRAVVCHREKVETKRGKRSTHKRRRGRGSTYRRRRGPTSRWRWRVRWRPTSWRWEGPTSWGPWQDLKHVLLQSVFVHMGHLCLSCMMRLHLIYSLLVYFLQKHQKTKKVLCLLIFANILVLPWGSLAFQFWLKKIPEAIQNSTHHFEDLIKMKTATIVRNHTDVPCIYIDSIHISPVILFPSYLLLTHTSGSKSHAGDSVLDITIFDMSNHQRLSI